MFRGLCAGLSLADGDHSDHGCAPVTMITAITMVSQAHVIMVITMVSQAHGDHRGEPWLTMVITMRIALMGVARDADVCMLVRGVGEATAARGQRDEQG